MSMVVGVLWFEMHLPAARSLKDKRRVVKGLVERMHSRWRVSVAETAYHDLHQRAEISVAVVATSEREIDRIFDGLRDLVDGEVEAMVTQWEPQVLEARG